MALAAGSDMNTGSPAAVVQAVVSSAVVAQAVERLAAGSGSLNFPDLSHSAGLMIHTDLTDPEAGSADPKNQTDLTDPEADLADPTDHFDLPDPTDLPDLTDCPETDHPFFSSIWISRSLGSSTFLNLTTNKIIPTHTKRMLNHCAIESGPINPLSSSPRKNSHMNLTIP